MTPHVKMATIVAPFLLIGGYIIADYYQTEKEETYLTGQAKKITAYELEKLSPCGLVDSPCEFKKGALKLTMSADNNSYHLESNQALRGASIGLAQSDRETRILHMQQIEGPEHWAIPIRRLTNLKKDQTLQMRMAVESGGDRYYVEFKIDTTGPWGVD